MKLAKVGLVCLFVLGGCGAELPPDEGEHAEAVTVCGPAPRPAPCVRWVCDRSAGEWLDQALPPGTRCTVGGVSGTCDGDENCVTGPPPPPPPPPEPPSTMTVWSERGYWGDSYTFSLAPTSPAFLDQWVPPSTLQNANLIGRISSAQVVCGDRPTEVYLFTTDALFHVTPADYVTISCQPGQTTRVDLHSTPSTPHGEIIADQISYLYMVVHTATGGSRSVAFSSFFKSAFDSNIQTLLPSNVTLPSSSTVVWDAAREFTVTQAVHISPSWPCGDGDGWFAFDAVVSTNASGLPQWSVTHRQSVSVPWWKIDCGLEGHLSDALDSLTGTVAAQLDSFTNFGAAASYYMILDGAHDPTGGGAVSWDTFSLHY